MSIMLITDVKLEVLQRAVICVTSLNLNCPNCLNLSLVALVKPAVILICFEN